MPPEAPDNVGHFLTLTGHQGAHQAVDKELKGEYEDADEVAEEVAVFHVLKRKGCF